MNHQKHKRILLVENGEIVREALCGFLKSEGYEVTEACNGTQAIETLKNAPFQTLITDIVMPGISGLEVLREVRKSSPATDVILISGITTMTHEKATALGAKAFISKSCQIGELIKNILETIER